MENNTPAIKYREGQEFLFNTSFRGIPFAMLLATVLAAYVYYNEGPKKVVIIWVTALFVLTCIRMIYFKVVINKRLLHTSASLHLKIFFYLTLLAGLIWSSIYFISIPYVEEKHQYVILLFMGAATAASTISLSIHFPSLFAFAAAILMPAMFYNLSFWNIDHSLLAAMLGLYLVGIAVIAVTNQKLLQNVFFLTKQIEVLSITDELTGLYNRRYFTKMIREEYNRAKRNQQSFAFISIDVDNFKSINDNFGHTIGDKFLMYTAAYLRNYLRRANDMIFRLGGDEFAVLIINATEESTQQTCNEIKSQFIKNPNFDYDFQDNNYQRVLGQVSLSVGVVYVSYESPFSIEQIIEKADQMLYKAKNEGKNKVIYTKC